MASRSASEHTSLGRTSGRAGQLLAPRSAAARAAPCSGRGSDRSSGGGGAADRGGRVDAGDQRARLAAVAAAPRRPREHEVIGGPRDGDVQQAGLLGPRLGGRRRAVRHEPGLDAGDDDGRPLPALGGVEREDLDAADAVGLGERVRRRDPRAQRGAVAERLVAQELEHGRGDLALGAVDRDRRRPVVGARARRGPSRAGGAPTAAPSPPARPWRAASPGPAGVACTGTPAAVERRGQPRQLGVRAGEHGDRPGAHGDGVERAHERGDERRLVVLVVGRDDAHRRRRRPDRDGAALGCPPARSTAVPAATICGVQRWLVGRWMTSTPGQPRGDVPQQARDPSR